MKKEKKKRNKRRRKSRQKDRDARKRYVIRNSDVIIADSTHGLANAVRQTWRNDGNSTHGPASKSRHARRTPRTRGHHQQTIDLDTSIDRSITHLW
ncbi:hypothetical protein Y032_0207g2024 [Ancylostoma ceylanicum]|uniref:Uncharacterized protein n=1 Tax=Ancylostoma ceylanicum TaxID=53326 RepID=A0A016SKZ9_9BILA|nr:hypothetical protein Y032_0207g2024 [Ancylostoma ceylanicum]